MSHFSKIKTNISSLSILKKTIKQLGFKYKLVNLPLLNREELISLNKYNLDIYSNNLLNDKPLCSFIWNSSEYNIVVDIELWNLDMDFNYFIDKLSQNYAYNVIISQSNLSGFEKVNEKVYDDGSIVMTVQRWSDNFI